MFQIGSYRFDHPIMLAPMEEVTDISYRFICREMGADAVFTEFINSDGLVRHSGKGQIKTRNKMKFLEQERPIGIQIYGNDIDHMVRSAVLSEEEDPDFIDINAGCWVKKVSHRGAGAGLLKDPPLLERMIKEVVSATSLPVTVKTRIGWDQNQINIIEIAQRLEAAGIASLTVHCRTRSQGHSGEADWTWIEKIKQKVEIPIVLNGGIMCPEDVKKAFDQTPCDGVMIARGAIGSPWIFQQAKELIEYGCIKNQIDLKTRIEFCLRHLKAFITLKTEPIGIMAFRKFYGGYLKGFPEIAKLRSELMKLKTYDEVEKKIFDFYHSVTEQEEVLL